MTSLDSFGAWALAQGQVANPNGTYPGQCVSLTQQYLYMCYGVPYAPRGNAKDFVPPEFHRLAGVNDLQPGDIVRYGANYGGGYGHIGIIDVNGKFLDQNGTVAMRVAVRNTPFSGIESVYRPDNRCALYDAQPATSNWNTKGIPTGATPQNGTFKASVNRNIRRQPGLNGEIISTIFTAGATQKYDCYVDADNFRWVSWIGASGNRNYTAVRRLSDNKRYGQCY